MARIDGATAICRVGWRDNRDGLDVALAVNRLLSAGAGAWWLTTAHEAVDAGDYLVELSSRQQRALASLGVATSPWHGDVPGDARALAAPVACLFAGNASKFPYFAYYAVAVLRLGIDYLPCDGPALAAGALDDANVLILPGGFATWGIDAAENAPGADAHVRDFLEPVAPPSARAAARSIFLPVVRDGLEPRKRSRCTRTSTCKVAWAS
jgi:hypothetical protein